MFEITGSETQPLVVASRRFTDGPTTEIIDPFTGEPLARVVGADRERAHLATEAAVHAFETMRTLPTYERKRILRDVAALLSKHAASFANAIAREAGKPITQARAEVERAISTFTIASEEASRLGGESLLLDLAPNATRVSGSVMRVPAGPVIAISPFNFPLNLVAHKIAPALACGCSLVLKPAPQTPLTSLLLAECIREAGAPENAVQVVPCANDVAETLVTDDRFRTFSFTGSAKVGWHLKSVSGKKRVLLELGGNAPVIVHHDADVERVAERVTAAAFGYAGQICIKVQRLVVQEEIAEQLIDEIVARARRITPSSPLDENTVMGPMIDEANAIRVETWVEEAKAAGAKMYLQGTRSRNRLGPTVLEVTEKAAPGLKVVDEEVFGPVLVAQRYRAEKEAIALAGRSRYGLQAGIFTDSLSFVRTAYAELEVGALLVNEVPTFRVDSMPYGGVRDSGLGREGVRYAMEEMTEPRLLVMRDK